jgi:hypothetical protein
MYISILYMLNILVVVVRADANADLDVFLALDSCEY